MKKNLQKGFTLVEILVVVTLLGLIGIIITQVFILGVRSQVKNEVMKEVRQNGDFIVNVIESMTRSAIDILETDCNTSTQELSIVNQDGYTTIFSCENNNIASTSAYPEPSPTVTVNLNTAKVKITDCSFRLVCPTPPIVPKYVLFNFTVSQAGSDTSPEQVSSMDYQSTVSLRGYE